MSKFLGNASFLLFEQVLKALVGVFVGIYVARHLGPAEFGTYNVVLAYVALGSTFAKLGLDGIVTRDLILAKGDEARQADIMRSASSLLMMSSMACWAVFAACIMQAGMENRTAAAIVTGGAVLCQSALVFDWALQSAERMVMSSIARSTMLVIAAVLRVIAIQHDSPAQVFYYIYAVEQTGIAIIIAMMGRDVIPYRIGLPSASIVMPLLRSSWPMLVSSLSVLIYTRLDQVMISHILGAKEAGIYAASARFYDAWMPIPYLISIAAAPRLMAGALEGSRGFDREFTRIFGPLFWLSILVSSMFALFSSEILQVTFGEKFLAGASCVAIMMFSTVWSAMGNASGRYLVIRKLEGRVASQTLVGVSVNVALNLVLIPKMGITGAAWSTLIATMASNLLFDVFDPEFKELRRIKIRALTFGMWPQPSSSKHMS